MIRIATYVSCLLAPVAAHAHHGAQFHVHGEVLWVASLLSVVVGAVLFWRHAR